MMKSVFQIAIVLALKYGRKGLLKKRGKVETLKHQLWEWKGEKAKRRG